MTSSGTDANSVQYIMRTQEIKVREEDSQAGAGRGAEGNGLCLEPDQGYVRGFLEGNYRVVPTLRSKMGGGAPAHVDRGASFWKENEKSLASFCGIC